MNSKQIITLMSGLCWDLSQIKGFDAFFEYNPHVDNVEIYINLNEDYIYEGPHNRIYGNIVYLPESQLHISVDVLKCADDLKAFIAEYGSKNNVSRCNSRL